MMVMILMIDSYKKPRFVKLTTDEYKEPRVCQFFICFSPGSVFASVETAKRRTEVH